MFSPEEAKAISSFIIKFLKLREKDAPSEEFDRWRDEVRTRFDERTEVVLLEIYRLLKKHLSSRVHYPLTTD